MLHKFSLLSNGIIFQKQIAAQLQENIINQENFREKNTIYIVRITCHAKHLLQL
jgi:hypothetical protein